MNTLNIRMVILELEDDENYFKKKTKSIEILTKSKIEN